MVVVRIDPTSELTTEILNAGGCVQLVARGFSMLPAIFPGDTLEIGAREFEKVCAGDVVFAANSNRVRAHRVLREEVSNGRRVLITRGDSLLFQDEQPVRNGELLGCVEFIVRRGRRLRPKLSTNRFHSALRFVLQRSAAAATFFVWLNLLLNRHFASRALVVTGTVARRS